MPRFTPEYVDATREHLRAVLPAGARIYTVLRGVSRSGLLRRVSVLYANRERGTVEDITGQVAVVLDWNRDRNDYLPVAGCGFNVATHDVGALGWALYRDEYALQGEAL